MTANNIRKLIALLNKKSFCGLRQYKMGTALGVSIDFELDHVKTWHASLSSIYIAFFYKFLLDVIGFGKLLFLFSSGIFCVTRHSKGCFDIANEEPNGRVVVYSQRKSGLFDKTNIVNIFLSSVWFIQLLNVPVSLKQKLYLVGKIGCCRKWILALSNEVGTSHPTLVTTYCDSHIYDNISAQFSRWENIPTATFQHGIYPASSEDLFSSGFELFVSNYFLAWGEYTKECAIASKVLSENIRIVGSLLRVDKIKEIPNDPVFGVMLSGSNTGKINLQLLELANDLAQRMGLKYIVKPHHNDTSALWGKICETGLVEHVCENNESLEQLAVKARFFLCPSTSTVAFDLVHIGAITFVHQNPYENHHTSCFGRLCFKSIEELLELIEWSVARREEYEKVAESIDTYAFASNGANAYQQFFECLHEGCE